MARFLKPVHLNRPYRYGVRYLKDDFDPWVRASLRLFDPILFDEVSRYTKRGASVPEVQRILKEVIAKDRSWIPEFTLDEQNDWNRTMREVIEDFSCDGFKVQPLTLEESIEGMVLDTSAGYGYPQGSKKEDVIDQIYLQAKQRILDCKMGRKVDAIPTTVGTRGHLHERHDPKRRLIYVFPAAQVVIERMFATPITEKQKANQGPAPMFMGKHLLRRLRDLLEKDNGRGSHTVQTDISGFDRDVIEWMIDQAFIVVEELIDFEHWDGNRIQPAAQKRWFRVFEMVKEYFKHTPIMSPEGEFMTMHGGVCSGSAFTQLIDSIVNALILRFIAKRTGHGIYDIKVLGDDGKVDIAGRPNLTVWAEMMMRYFGMTLSVKKSRIYGRKFRQKRFLGYDITNGFLVRDQLELFNLAAHPENDVHSLVQSATRMVAYMHLGGIHDLKFCQFFEFYQTCFPFPEDMPQLDYDLKTKRRYAGFEIEMKPLSQYTVKDFRWGLFR